MGWFCTCEDSFWLLGSVLHSQAVPHFENGGGKDHSSIKSLRQGVLYFTVIIFQTVSNLSSGNSSNSGFFDCSAAQDSFFRNYKAVRPRFLRVATQYKSMYNIYGALWGNIVD